MPYQSTLVHATVALQDRRGAYQEGAALHGKGYAFPLSVINTVASQQWQEIAQIGNTHTASDDGWTATQDSTLNPLPGYLVLETQADHLSAQEGLTQVLPCLPRTPAEWICGTPEHTDFSFTHINLVWNLPVHHRSPIQLDSVSLVQRTAFAREAQAGPPFIPERRGGE